MRAFTPLPPLSGAPPLRPHQHVARCGIRVESGPVCSMAGDDYKPPLLELRDIKYTVPRDRSLRLLRGANVQIHEREFIVFVGENGAGKSTCTFNYHCS